MVTVVLCLILDPCSQNVRCYSFEIDSCDKERTKRNTSCAIWKLVNDEERIVRTGGCTVTYVLIWTSSMFLTRNLWADVSCDTIERVRAEYHLEEHNEGYK